MPGGTLTKNRGGRLEDDALFREIGGQLAGLSGGSFDYSQWQRTYHAKSPTKSISSLKEKPPASKPPKRPDTVQTGNFKSLFIFIVFTVCFFILLYCCMMQFKTIKIIFAFIFY